MKQKSMNWVEKYRPQTLSQVVGHPTAIEELRSWALSWLDEDNIPKDRAIIIYGNPGTGKTTSAFALANDMEWELIELNASDQRTAKIIEKVAGSGSQMEALGGGRRLIVLDEADNIHGNADRGGEKAIIGVIKKTRQPIILIANELYDMSYGLRSSCRPMQFRSVTKNSIISTLKKIAKSEGITCEIDVFEKIATNADGDLRGAINDLEALSLGRSVIMSKDVVTNERDSKEGIFQVLGKIFRGTNAKDAHKATYDLDENPDDLIQWIDENLPDEYTKPEDLVRAYSYLSRASLFLGRVKRRRNYNMWRYASLLMTSGIVVAKAQKYMGYVKSRTPSIRKRLSDTKSKRKIRDSLAKKIGAHCHTSIAFTRMNLFPFFKSLMRNKKYTLNVVALLELDLEEIAFIMDSKPETKEIQKIYEEAQAIIKKETDYEVEIFGGFGKGRIKVESKEKVETKKETKKMSVRKEENIKETAQRSLLDY